MYWVYGPFGLDWNPSMIYFDHKLASPLSTISILLGCGIYEEELFGGNIKVNGNILKNCKNSVLKCKDMEQMVEDLFKNRKTKYGEVEYLSIYKPEIHESQCTFCPKPVYKLSNDEVIEIYKKSKLSPSPSRGLPNKKYMRLTFF